MEIEISGYKNETKKAAIRACVSWLIRDLKLEKNHGLIHIVLKNQKQMPDLGQMEEVLPGYYVLVLRSNLSIVQTLQTICHEMVHVYQHAKGLFKIPECKTHYLWKGKKYETDHPYYERPWEIQAFEKEVLLFRRATEFFSKGK